METNPTTRESDDDSRENAVCDVCGEEFENPLLAEIISGDSAAEYQACPRCLSKVCKAELQERIEVDEADEAEEDTDEEDQVAEVQDETEPVNTEGPSTCPYHLGYLKARPKNSPIPDNCFVCIKMIECTR